MSESEPGRRLEWAYLGRLAYPRATALQTDLRDRIRSDTGPDALVFVEHPHVLTLGRNAHRTDVVAPQEWLETHGVTVEESDRGGQVTYHGPGQLVGYPIINLDPDRRDLRRYVRDLQEVLVRTLADFGVAAQSRTSQPEVGIWVGEQKIASLGVHISRWITTHGFALNVTTDLEMFDAIVPCGLSGVRMASIESLGGGRPELDRVARVCVKHFCEVFDRSETEVSQRSWLTLDRGGRQA